MQDARNKLSWYMQTHQNSIPLGFYQIGPRQGCNNGMPPPPRSMVDMPFWEGILVAFAVYQRWVRDCQRIMSDHSSYAGDLSRLHISEFPLR